MFIAQRPIEPRDASRLLVLERGSGALHHLRFCELPEYLRSGDLLVLNNSLVLRARLHGLKSTGGKVEMLLIKRINSQTWEVMVGGRRLIAGSRISLSSDLVDLTATVMQQLDGPRRVVRFSQPITPLLENVGEMPLPPYIREPLDDDDRYQTVFASTPGSVAAPTAGLHFTPALLSQCEDRDVKLAHVTLHIGLDTFAPVKVADVSAHPVHSEWCELDALAAHRINETRVGGGRVVAVGTTTVRVLEKAALTTGEATVREFRGETDLLIIPGHEFRAVDALITNFHLPRSTLLMLASAFAAPNGREKILAAYEAAKQEGYRFHSFGDAMLIV